MTLVTTFVDLRDVTTGGAQGALAPPVFLELLRRNIPCTCIWPELYYIVHPQILALCNIPVSHCSCNEKFRLHEIFRMYSKCVMTFLYECLK